MGFEPTTFSLARRRTTAVLRPQILGAEAQNRTGDTTVFSRVLYQLSYLALRLESSPVFASSRPPGFEAGADKRRLRRRVDSL